MKQISTKHLKWSLVGKLVLRLVIFSAVYWAAALAVILLWNYFFWDDDVIFFLSLIVYAAGILICFYSVLATAAKYVETIEGGIHAVAGRFELEEFPGEIKSAEMALRNLQYINYYNEHTAREAEQRKNDLVVYLAHDLKTPLTSVIGYLSLLEESPDLPVEQRAKYTAITLDKAYRLEHLINEFFDITRFNLQSIELENNRVDIGVMLRQMAEEFYPSLSEKSLDITVTVREDITLIGDADKLARVFDNLLRNAISYSYTDTTIVISAWKDDQYALITVRNQGDEIPLAQLDRLFEKFFRLDSARQSRSGGAGLGLAIAKQIVEQHHGRITVRSTPECTEFLVALPLRK